MKDSLKISAYILLNSKNRTLSNARLTKLIYLCDWKSCLVDQHQISNISWYYNNYGPFVWDVLIDISHHREYFEIQKYSGSLGSINTTIKLLNFPDNIILDEYTKSIANFVINQTNDMNWEEFIGLIYSTYPIVRSKKFSNLNLKRLAADYKSSNLWNRASALLSTERG